MSDARYDEIMRRLQERQHRLTVVPVRAQLIAALDALNVWETLTVAKAAAPQTLIAEGPRTSHHHSDTQSVTGTVIWCRERAYGGHSQLVLLGVWATLTINGIDLVTGTKHLPFTAPHFNAESYHKIVRKDYHAYYADDHLPPPSEQRLSHFTYDAAQRLDQRKAIKTTLIAYMRANRAG